MAYKPPKFRIDSKTANNHLNNITFGNGKKIDKFFNPDKPDTSMDDADMAAAEGLYDSSIDEFVGKGPEVYSDGPLYTSGAPLDLENLTEGEKLQLQNLSEGEKLQLQQMGAFDQLGPSEMGNISTDPRYKDAEMAALADLEERSKNGFTARDEADMAKLNSQVNQQNRGRMGAIQQNMASRGMAGSGLDILAQTQAGQDATERQALAALEKNAQMQERKVDAVSRLGGLAGQLQGRDFQQSAQKAAASDAINRFNIANSIDRTKMNNSIANQGTTQNWNRSNQVSDANVGINNSAAIQNWNRGNQVSDANVGINNQATTQNWGRTNSTADRNTGRTQQTMDNNTAAGGRFNTQVLGARTGQATNKYDRAADSKNSKLGVYKDKTDRRDNLIGGVVNTGVKAAPMFMAEGGEVEDSYMNDTVPVMASPGEKIIPKSVAAEGIDQEAAFVERTDAEQAIKGLLEAMNYLTKKRG